MAAKPAKKSVALSGVAVAETAICSIDPEQGILRYRGYDIADLAEHSTYEEVAYLLLDGELPTEEQLNAFKEELTRYKWATGSVQFPLDEPLPGDLIRRIVEYRVKECAQRDSK